MEIQAELERQLTQIEKSREASRNTTPKTPRGGGGDQDTVSNISKTEANVENTTVNLNASKAIRKAEEKKQRKEKRKAEWEILLKSRPDDKYINPKVRHKF